MGEKNTIHQKLNHLLSHRDDPQYKEYHDEFGMLDLNEWLFDNGVPFLKGRNYGKYVIKGFDFNETHQLSNVIFDDIILHDCSVQNCDLTDSYFEGSRFRNVKSGGANFNGTHFRNHTWTYEKISNTDFSGATFEDCVMSYSSFTNCTFTGAQLIDKTHSVAYQKKHDQYYRVNFNECDFDGASFQGMLLNHFYFKECSMIGTAMRHVIFRAIKFASNIDRAVFDHVGVAAPYNRDNIILLGPAKNSTNARTLRNSVITNCDWDVLHFIEQQEPGIDFLSNNTMENNTLSCADLESTNNNGTKKTYSGTALQRFMQARNRPAPQLNNNYAPQRFLGFPCVNNEGGTQSNLQRGGILALYLTVIILGLTLFYKVLTKCILPRISSCRKKQDQDSGDNDALLLEDQGEVFDDFPEAIIEDGSTSLNPNL